jgi:DNA polymerase delta subunit 1
LKDALLPQKLMDKLSVMVNYIEMARVTGVPLSYLLARGQQIKVFSMLLRKCKLTGLLIQTLAKSGGDDVTYEGATVIEPKKAYYEMPIATLDFASLYPSIMQAYNLCYSTLVAKDDVAKLPPGSYQQTPSGDYFVTAETKKGLLPQILDELLSARKRAKKDMARATDPMEKAVQNGRQLALKVSANSVYGFTGATVGQLPCIPIASSVTSYGRQLLLSTREFVEKRYTVQNGFPADAEVVYGDTDSVMIKFGVPTVEAAMPLAQQASEEVSKIFPPPIRLEFEKVYYPYLLMNKKRYAGLLWTNPNKYDKLDAKGLETVRRDNCLLVRQLVDTCLRKILVERNVQGAIDYAKGVISDLLQNRMDISVLVITKSLGKSADSEGYTAKQAHVELAMRMKKRDPGTAPNVGDRVPYVIIQAAKGAPAYERSEDPVYVLENNLPIDTEYYLQNQLAGPLHRIFEPIVQNPDMLLNGDHTRSVRKLTPAAKAGGIMMFAVKKTQCLGCRIPIAESEGSLCQHCREREGEIYMQKLEAVHEHEQVFASLWTECQRCQGSLHQDVICSNRDCTIFYKRKKVQKDLKDAQEALDRCVYTG